MLRIAHFVTHPIQYFAPLYREIAKQPAVELTVLFGSDFGTKPSFDPGLSRVVQFDTPLLDGFQSEFLSNQGDGKPGQNSRSFDCPELDAVLTRDRFDVVWIHGWGYRFQHQAALAARTAKLPYLIRGESTLLEAPPCGLRWLRRRWKSGAFLQRADGCLFVGQNNRDFLRSMGVAENRLWPCHYSVDARFFSEQALIESDRLSLRRKYLARPNEIIVLTVAKLIPRKCVADLVKAIAKCPSHVKLWVAGDGAQAVELKELSDQLTPARVIWLGFVNQNELPQIMSAADVFALASAEETWGLVVNEAMACSLPCITSDKVGCASDLVRESETGHIFPHGNVAQLARFITDLAKDPTRIRAMGRAAQTRVLQHYSVQETSRQLVAAASAACSGRETLAQLDGV
jgi:glycosyltransferase involved in cell wall biosynthesis